MVNNLILWACIAVNDEGLRLGRALGVDPERLCEALRHAARKNWAMDTQAERAGMPWAEKDMSIVHGGGGSRALEPAARPAHGQGDDQGPEDRMGLGMPEIPERL